MVNEDRLPRTAYELIEMLDGTIRRPALPATQTGWRGLDENAVRALAFAAGARSLVDMLVGQMKEEVGGEDADGLSDRPPLRFARVLGEGAHVYQVELDPDGLDDTAPE